MSLPGCYLSHSPRDLWLMTLHKMPSPAPAPFLAPQPLPVELVWLDAAILARGSRRTGCSSPAGLSRHGRLPAGSCAQEPHEHPHCSSAVAPRLWPRARWEAGTLGQEEPQHSCRPSLASHRGKHLERIGAAAAGHVGLSGASTGFTTASLCPSALPQHRGSSKSHLHRDAGSGSGSQPVSPLVSSLDLQCVLRDHLWQEAVSPKSGG